jgi:hypothetical protein
MENNSNSLEKSVDDLYSGKTSLYEPTQSSITGKLPNPYQVKERITGSFPGPLPSQRPPGPPNTFDPQARKQALQDMWDSQVMANEDKNQWAKVYQYDDGPKGTFAERYHDFNQWGKSEFHPRYLNNENKLNENTSFLGDLFRTTTGAVLPLAWNGIKSVYASNVKLITEGDFFGEDADVANEYDRITARYHSSKDNIGSFVNNLTMNLGYTAGIISTAMFENIAGAALGGLMGAKTIAPRSAKELWNAYKAGEAVDGINTYSQLLDKLGNIDEVRKVWEKTNGIGTMQKVLTSKAGQVLNPFSNMTEAWYSTLNNADDFTGFFKTGNKIARTAGAAYRDLRNINLAVSEGRLEAGMVYNNLFNELYSEHFTRTGAPPSEEELKNIIAQAKQAGYETAAMNSGLIFLTNKISFDNILNPRVGAKGFLQQRILDWKSVGGGRFGELGNVVFDVAANEWKFAEKGFKTWWNGWKTDPFHKSAWGTIGYFKRNLLEGAQEVSQEAIAYANEKYYKDTFYTKPVRQNLISKAAFGEGTTPWTFYKKGLGQQMSGEGLSVFASGLFMGALAGGLNKTMTFLYEKANQIFDPTNYESYKTEKSKIVDDLVTQMNAFGVEEMVNSRLFNAGAQDILNRVQETGNKKENMDAESEALASHMMMLNEYGVLDPYLNAIESYTKMTDAEFKETFPKLADKDIEVYKNRIAEVVDKSKQIKKSIDTYKKIFPNPIDLSRYSKDDPFYDDAYIMHKAWNDNIKSAVFFNQTFNNVRERMVGIMDKHYEERPLQGMTKRQSDLILRPEDMYNEISLLKNEADNLIAVGDPESKKLAKAKLKEAQALENYYVAYSEFADYYSRDRYFARAKDKLQTQKGQEVTNEEVNDYLDATFGPKDEDTEAEVLLNLEKAYNDVLKTISGKPDDYLFTDRVDEAFELVLDFYKLNDESRGLVDAINMLNDPQGFMDVYNRNVEWMTDIWNKRGEYYKDIVQQELSDIEDNGLLNWLANQGIYMSVNDFLLWRDQGIPPTEFYDEKKKMGIPQGSLAYDNYLMKLFEHRKLKDTTKETDNEAIKQETETAVNALLKKKEKELANLKAQFEENLVNETGQTYEEWEKKTPEKPEGRTKEQIAEEIDYLKKEINDLESISNDELLGKYDAYIQLDPPLFTEEEYLSVVDEILADPVEGKKLKKYARKLFNESDTDPNDLESVRLAQNISLTTAQNKYALPILLNRRLLQLQNETPAADFDPTPPVQKTKSWEDYQKQIEITEKKYEGLIEAVENKIKEPSKSPRTPKTAAKKQTESEVSIDTPWDELPNDLKAELQEEFDIFLTAPEPEGMGKRADLKDINSFEYEKLRNSWFATKGDRIKMYNERPVDFESALPNLKYIELTKAITEYSLTSLKMTRDQLEKMLDANKDSDGNKLNNSTRTAIKNDIAELNKYIKYLRSNYITEKNNQAITFTIFNEMVVNRQNEVERIMDGKNVIGYKFTDKEERPERVTKITSRIKSDIKNEPEFPGYDPVNEDEKTSKKGPTLLNLFDEIIKNDEIKSEEKLNYFMTSLENEIKRGSYAQLNSQRKLDIIRGALSSNLTRESLKEAVQKVAYDESTIAGNTVDDMTRESFRIGPDGKFMKPEKSSKINQLSYDNLFGDNGIITELQDSVIDGKYKILSSDVLIFDKTLLNSLGLVGAMDLIAFNRETGDLVIIDVKTSKNWTNFSDEDNKYSKKLDYRIQLSIYRTLLYNMTGILAKTISILPVETKTDMDGNISYAVSAANQVNAPLIRNLQSKLSTLEKAKTKDTKAISALENELKNLKKSVLAPLEPVAPEVLAKYGIEMIEPNLPEELKQENKAKSEPVKPVEKDEKEVAAKIKKLKTDIAKLKKNIEKVSKTAYTTVKGAIQENPELKKLNQKLEQLENELATLEGTPVKEGTPPVKFDIDAEIDALLKGTSAAIFNTEAETFTKEEFKNIIKKMNSATNLEDLKEVYMDGLILISEEPNLAFADVITRLNKNKKQELNTSVSEDILQPGDTLISKNPIFGIENNEPVKVKQVKDGKIVIEQIVNRTKGKKASVKTITEDKIKSDFIKNTEEAIKQETEKTIVSDVDKSTADLAKGSIENLAQNQELLKAAKQQAAGDKKSRFAAAKNIIKNNNIDNCTTP